ncbi:MAG: hypothetical protein WAT91_11625 [Saprospiraceae bacterium]
MLIIVLNDSKNINKQWKFLEFVNGGPLEVTLELTLTSAGDATEMESKFIATPHGFIRAIFPIFRKKMKRQEQENMMNLKKALEQ